MWLLRRARPKTTAKLYSDCSELPITVFYRIIETGDLSLLTIEGNASADDLQRRWDEILREFEKLTGKANYQQYLRENAHDLAAVNRLNALISLYYIVIYSGDDISQDAAYWKVKPTKEAIRMVIMREQTRLNIATIEKTKTEPQKKTDFYDLWTSVENGLNRSIDVENCSVRKWVSLCKSLEDKIKHLKKQGNGRNYTQ
jgi:hypothetical protein